MPVRALPAKAAAVLLLAVLTAVGGWSVGYAWRDRGARADLAECQRVHAEALAITLRAAQATEAEYRATEAAWNTEKQEIVHDAKSDLDAATADRDRVRAALERMRKQVAAASRDRDTAAHPAAGAGSAATRPAADLQNELLGRLGEAAGELAAAADAARVAGKACERSYDSLKTPRLGEAR